MIAGVDGHTLAIVWILSCVFWAGVVILKAYIASWRIDRSFRRDGLVWRRVRR